ncbi:hypothetical protein [Vibrio eleionomae]|uniref:hypothetical protein n=1 Tax=Vibrio eleionomae TaxID=2653505 RepID=UPI00136EE1B4|nr:hypothetical protein [Vibrio eleionomae]
MKKELNHQLLDQLMMIAERKKCLDHNSDWFQGPDTYLSGLVNEVAEVRQEIESRRTVYLEDELPKGELYSLLGGVTDFQRRMAMSSNQCLA